MQEIDQRSKHALLFPCACGGTDHLIEFDYDPDPGWKEYLVSVIDPNSVGFWDRVKDAFKYVFYRKKIYHSAVMLNSNDLRKVQAHMQEYIDLK